MAYRSYSIAKDVTKWLQPIISNEKWFGDGSPIWREAQTSSGASAERLALIKVLRRRPKEPRLRLLITRLKSCEPLRRCHSAACPECTRALQRYFVAQIKISKLEFVCVSLVADTLPTGQLHSLDVTAFHLRVRRLLQQAGIQIAVGGVDYSLNTDAQKNWADHWSIHLWLLVPALLKGWEVKLRRCLIPTRHSRRPIFIKAFDGDLAGAAYALKNKFYRRLSYFQISKKRRNTRELKLRVSEKRELAAHLNQSGLGGRLFVLSLHHASPRAVFRRLRQSPAKLSAGLRRQLVKANR